MENEITGIIYYDREGYPGDINNHKKGLTGKQIDNNFYFLRGKDIENISFEENYIIFKRLNGQKDLKLLFDLTGTTYDSQTGTLKLKIGTSEHNVEGINTVNYNNTYYDSKNGVLHLELNGQEYDVNGFIIPSSVINSSEITGMMLPVKKVLDEDEELPKSHDFFDSYITKEKRNKLGNLYNLDAMLALKNYLLSKGSKWHIPTYDEWSSMLNAIELCEEDKNHNIKQSTELGDYRGKYAGLLIKDKNHYFRCNEEEIQFDDDEYFFNAQPIDRESGKLSGAHFWTTTKENNKYWEKGIIKCSYKVYQELFNDNRIISIRLIKNENLSGSKFDKIGNYDYICCTMPNENENFYTWTAENIRITKEELEPFAEEGYNNIIVVEDEDIDEINTNIFILNTWNGYEWQTRKIKNGEVFVDISKEYKQFVIKNGKIIYDLLENYHNKQEIDTKFDEVDTKFEEVEEKIKKAGKVDDVLIKTFKKPTYETTVKDKKAYISIPNELFTEGDIKIEGGPIEAKGIWENDTIPSGTSVNEILVKLLYKEIFPYPATLPSITINGTESKILKINTKLVEKSISLQKNNGKFNAPYTTPSQPSPLGVTWSNDTINKTYEGFVVEENEKFISVGINKIKYNCSSNYTAPTNKPITNVGNETTKTGLTAPEGSAIWTDGIASKTGETIYTGVYPIFTNNGSTELLSGTTIELELKDTNTFEIEYKKETDNIKVKFAYPKNNSINSVEILNPLSGKYEKYNGDKEITSEYKTINNKQYEYNVWNRVSSTKNGTMKYKFILNKKTSQE